MSKIGCGVVVSSLLLAISAASTVEIAAGEGRRLNTFSSVSSTSGPYSPGLRRLLNPPTRQLCNNPGGTFPQCQLAPVGDSAAITQCAAGAEINVIANMQGPKHQGARDWEVVVDGLTGTSCKIHIAAIPGTNGTVTVRTPPGVPMHVELQEQHGSPQVYPILIITELEITLQGVDHLQVVTQSADARIDIDYIPSVMDMLIAAGGSTVALNVQHARSLVVDAGRLDLSDAVVSTGNASVAVVASDLAALSTVAPAVDAAFDAGCLNFAVPGASPVTPQQAPSAWMARRLLASGVEPSAASACKLYAFNLASAVVSGVGAMAITDQNTHVGALSTDATGAVSIIDTEALHGPLSVSVRTINSTSRYSVMLTAPVATTAVKVQATFKPTATLHMDCRRQDSAPASSAPVDWMFVDAAGVVGDGVVSWHSDGRCGGVVSDALATLPQFVLAPSQDRDVSGDIIHTNFTVRMITRRHDVGVQHLSVRQRSLSASAARGRELDATWLDVDPTLNVYIVSGDTRVEWEWLPQPALGATWRNNSLHLVGNATKANITAATAVVMRIPTADGTKLRFHGEDHSVSVPGLYGETRTKTDCVNAGSITDQSFLGSTIQGDGVCNTPGEEEKCEAAAALQLDTQSTLTFFATTPHVCQDNATRVTFSTPVPDDASLDDSHKRFPYAMTQRDAIAAYFWTTTALTVGMASYHIFAFELQIPLLILGFTNTTDPVSSLHVVSFGQVSYFGFGWNCGIDAANGNKGAADGMVAAVLILIIIFIGVSLIAFGRCKIQKRVKKNDAKLVAVWGEFLALRLVSMLSYVLLAGLMYVWPLGAGITCLMLAYLVVAEQRLARLQHAWTPRAAVACALIVPVLLPDRWLGRFRVFTDTPPGAHRARDPSRDRRQRRHARVVAFSLLVSIVNTVMVVAMKTRCGCDSTDVSPCAMAARAAIALCIIVHVVAWWQVAATAGSTYAGTRGRILLALVVLFLVSVVATFIALFAIVADTDHTERARWQVAMAWLCVLPVSRLVLEVIVSVQDARLEPSTSDACSDEPSSAAAAADAAVAGADRSLRDVVLCGCLPSRRGPFYVRWATQYPPTEGRDDDGGGEGAGGASGRDADGHGVELQHGSLSPRDEEAAPLLRDDDD